MASADMGIGQKHMMISSAMEVRRDFAVGKAVEVVEEVVVSFPHEHCGEVAVLQRHLEKLDQAAGELV